MTDIEIEVGLQLPHLLWPTALEDCLLIGDVGLPRALSVARLRLGDGGWEVDRAIDLDDEWHGACVMARSDDALIGVLLVEKGRGRIVAPPLDSR